MKDKKKKKVWHNKRGQRYKTTVVCDTYDENAFVSLKEKSPKLSEMEEKGTEKIVTFPPLMQDVYSSLYKMAPKLREAKEILPSHRYNRSIIEQLMKTEEFKELKTYTQLDEFASAMATLSLASSAIEMVPEETQEKIQEMNNLEEKNEQLQDQIDGLKGAANQAASQAKNLQSQAQEAMSQGNQTEAQDLQSQANNLFSQAQKFQNQAASVQMTLKEAKVQIESLESEVSEEIQKNSSKIRQAVRKAADEALEDAKETSEIMEAWGQEAGEIQQLPYEEKMKRAEILKSSSKMKKLAKLTGRFKRLAIGTQRTKVKETLPEIFDVKIGQDLDKILPSELLRLNHPLMKYEFYTDWAGGKLLQYEVKGKEKEGKGPIIVCCDNSGSMEGSKELWSKAVALALLDVAKVQKRNFACIHFGSSSDPIKVIEVPKGQASFEIALEIGQYFLNGGTDFMKPLSEAVTLIEKQEYKKADILFITDGECTVSDEFLKEFREAKKRKEFKVISILMDVGETTPTAVKEFSDDIQFVSELSSQEAQKIFEAV